MKTLKRLISGIAASLLLAAGLHAAAEKLDPVTRDSQLSKPEDTSNDRGTLSRLPCQSCIEDQ